MTVVPIHPNAIRVPDGTNCRTVTRAAVVIASLAAVFAIALALRLYKLGAWAFWGDELVTFYDSHMLWTQPYWSPTGYINPHEQFIHAWPIGFWLCRISLNMLAISGSERNGESIRCTWLRTAWIMLAGSCKLRWQASRNISINSTGRAWMRMKSLVFKYNFFSISTSQALMLLRLMDR